MSTFGLSSFTGNNNPFQLITLTVASYIEPPQNPAVPQDNPDPTPKPTASPTPVPTPLHTQNATPASGLVPESRTAQVYTNADGIVTQATTLSSPDGFVTISLDPGVVGKGFRTGDRSPPSPFPPSPVNCRVPSREIHSLPGGHTICLRTVQHFPRESWSGLPHLRMRNSGMSSLSWDLTVNPMPGRRSASSYNISSGRVTARVPHFCCFGLFTREKKAGLRLFLPHNGSAGCTGLLLPPPR